MTARPALRLPSLADLEAAREQLDGLAVRTPLIRLPSHASRVTRQELFLKLENLQPIGSFKIRGAGNAMRRLPAEMLSEGVCTASAGNMAQGVAWHARRLGIRCTVIVPDHAPETKLAAITRLGGTSSHMPPTPRLNIALCPVSIGSPSGPSNSM